MGGQAGVGPIAAHAIEHAVDDRRVDCDDVVVAETEAMRGSIA